MTRRAAGWLGGVLLLLSAFFHVAQAAEGVRLQFLGYHVLPKNLTVAGTPVGGLSALTWDPASRTFLAVSDDRSEKAPARLYRIDAKITDAGLGDVAVTEVTLLRRPDDSLFPKGAIDAEGMARLPDGRLLISSEGDIGSRDALFVGLFGQDGGLERTLPLPPGFEPDDLGNGARNNLSFEGVTLVPGTQQAVLEVENALLQDGPATTVEHGSPSRFTFYDLRTGRPGQQYVYDVGAIPVVPLDPRRPGDNGISDILALDENRLFVLERGYTPGVGNTIRLFLADRRGATDVEQFPSLRGASYTPMHRQLVLDFATLNAPLDNVEAITFGPRLADGRATLLFTTDDNFNPAQRTVFYAFALAVD